MTEMTMLKNNVVPDSELKQTIVNYVGNIFNPEDGNVTIEMVIDVLAEQFPDLLLCISEENWMRGYHQALSDVDEGEKILNEELHKAKK